MSNFDQNEILAHEIVENYYFGRFSNPKTPNLSNLAAENQFWSYSKFLFCQFQGIKN